MQSRGRQRIDDDRHQAGAAKLHRRNIDGDMHMLRPLRRRGASLPDHPFSQGHDEADLFRQRNESRWWDLSALGMIPAEQRFETADLAALQIHHRLVLELEFPRW